MLEYQPILMDSWAMSWTANDGITLCPVERHALSASALSPSCLRHRATDGMARAFQAREVWTGLVMPPRPGLAWPLSTGRVPACVIWGKQTPWQFFGLKFHSSSCQNL